MEILMLSAMSLCLGIFLAEAIFSNDMALAEQNAAKNYENLLADFESTVVKYQTITGWLKHKGYNPALYESASTMRNMNITPQNFKTIKQNLEELLKKEYPDADWYCETPCMNSIFALRSNTFFKIYRSGTLFAKLELATFNITEILDIVLEMKHKIKEQENGRI